MLTTERMILRRPIIEDAPAHFEIHGDPETNEHNPSGPINRPSESGKILSEWIDHWEGNGFGYWAACLREEPDRIVGFGGIMKKTVAGKLRLNLYFRFSPLAWGRGLATELGHYAISSASLMPDASRVFALVRPDNTASINVLGKLRMVLIDEVKDVPGSKPSLLFATAHKPGT